MRKERDREIMQRLVDAGERFQGLLSESSMVQSASVYTDAEHFARELRILFREGATFLGLSASCSQPGDYLVASVGAIPIVVVRQNDGSLRGMVNVCRHRGSPLFTGPVGTMNERISCGYHAWTYDRGGQLASRPMAAEAFNDINFDCGLHPVVVAEKHGLIFVRGDGVDPIDVDHVLGGAQDDLGAFGLNNYVHIDTRVNTWPFNWKLVLDTFTESYHVRTLHRESIAPYFLSDVSLVDEFDRNLLMISLRNTVDREFAKLYDDRSVLPYGTIQYFLVPSGLVVHQIDHVEVWRIEPVDARTTTTITSVFSPVPPEQARGRGYYLKNLDLLLDVVGSEDFTLMEKIQQNLDSGSLPHLVYGRNEHALTYLHQSIERLLTAENHL
jgi:phenylpropionate dioxygenase-like ring-hydroxylating dioxygenase large terminal subunit